MGGRCQQCADRRHDCRPTNRKQFINKLKSNFEQLETDHLILGRGRSIIRSRCIGVFVDRCGSVMLKKIGVLVSIVALGKGDFLSISRPIGLAMG